MNGQPPGFPGGSFLKKSFSENKNPQYLCFYYGLFTVASFL